MKYIKPDMEIIEIDEDEVAITELSMGEETDKEPWNLKPLQ